MFLLDVRSIPQQQSIEERLMNVPIAIFLDQLITYMLSWMRKLARELFNQLVTSFLHA